MQAVVFENGRAAVRDVAEPEAREGEVLVDVLSAGVCATDLALLRGYRGFTGVPGHEFVGVARSGAHAGRRVVGEINAACGQCDSCESGLQRHCPRRTVLGILGRPGAFAQTLALPARNLFAVPDSLTTDEAVFVEPLAAAMQIAEQCELRPGDRAVVAGDGRLGLLCAMVLARAGLPVSMVGRHPERASLLPDSVRYLEASLPGPPPARKFDLAVEATGNPEVLGSLLSWVRPRGTLVLKTTAERPATLHLAPLVVDEITLVGSRCGRFAPALEALARGQISVAGLVQDRFPLRAAEKALARAAEPGTLKVLLDVERRVR